VELELFTVFGADTKSGSEMGGRLGLHPRSKYDFLDALVALGLLDREGDGPEAMCRAVWVLTRWGRACRGVR